MHKIRPSEIYIMLKYGNIEEAEKMYQCCNINQKQFNVKKWEMNIFMVHTKK